MNNKIKYLIRIIAVLFLVIGTIGFFIPCLIFFIDLDSIFPDSFELPFGDLKGIAVDSKGNIYCGLPPYSRVQVYNKDGKYIYGKFFDSNGGAFRIRINNNDQLEVATARNDKLYVFENSNLINELSNVGYFYDEFGKAGETRYHDQKQNVTYMIKSALLYPYVVKRDSLGKENIVIRTSFYKWLFAMPLPSWLFVVVGAILSTITLKDPWKHILRRYYWKKFIMKNAESSHKKID